MKSYHKTHKKKSKHIFDPPLPGTSWTFQEKIRRKYEGEFIGFGVWIKDKVQALDIFDSGFFGKGGLNDISIKINSKKLFLLFFLDKNVLLSIFPFMFFFFLECL